MTALVRRTLVTTQRLVSELRRRNISLLPGPGQQAKAGVTIVIDDGAVWETDCQLVGPLLARRFGAFSYSRSQLSQVCEVGRYCSIGKLTDFMLDSHPTDWASTSPFSYEVGAPAVTGYLRRQGVQDPEVHSYNRSPRPILIGHDVFIGNKVLLKAGISIGNGAVIGGGSVVTKDVAPYAVMGGAPARLIRYRFEPELIERFSAVEWWRFGPDHLLKLKVPEPAVFLDGVERLIADGIAHAKVGRVTGQQIVEWCSDPDTLSAL